MRVCMCACAPLRWQCGDILCTKHTQSSRFSHGHSVPEPTLHATLNRHSHSVVPAQASPSPCRQSAPNLPSAENSSPCWNTASTEFLPLLKYSPLAFCFPAFRDTVLPPLECRENLQLPGRRPNVHPLFSKCFKDAKWDVRGNVAVFSAVVSVLAGLGHYSNFTAKTLRSACMLMNFVIWYIMN